MKTKGELLSIFYCLMGGGDRVLMKGHCGRMRRKGCKLQQGHFLTGHKVFTVKSGKALEIARDFQNFGR